VKLEFVAWNEIILIPKMRATEKLTFFSRLNRIYNMSVKAGFDTLLIFGGKVLGKVKNCKNAIGIRLWNVTQMLKR
jgi:hypothetical protein